VSSSRRTRLAPRARWLVLHPGHGPTVAADHSDGRSN
jgi:hypothetical protein